MDYLEVFNGIKPIVKTIGELKELIKDLPDDLAVGQANGPDNGSLAYIYNWDEDEACFGLEPNWED